MKILGLELGTSSVRALEVDSSFGRFEIREYHERPVLNTTDPMETLANLIRGLPSAPDRLAICLHSSQSTFRNLDLPTREKKALQAGVKFELDDELPFDVETAQFDYSVLSQASHLSSLHVAATTRHQLETFIQKLRSFGIDPELITTESWALRTLLARIKKIQPLVEPYLIARMGHSRTLIYVQNNDRPVLIREISWGGKHLTELISQHYGISIEQAEQTKLNHGFILAQSQEQSATPEQKEFSDVLLGSFVELIQEIKQAKLACKTITKQSVATLTLSGGTSLLPGLLLRLEEELKMPIAPLKALSQLTNAGITYSEPVDARFALCAGAALGVIGADKTTAINFRRGSFGKGRSRNGITLESLKRPLICAGIVAASLVLSLFVQRTVYQVQVEELNSKLERSIRSFFGTVSPGVLRSYIANPNLLKKQMETELGRQREQAKLFSDNPNSPLAFLREISKSTSKDTVVDLTQFQMGSSAESGYQLGQGASLTLTFLIQKAEMIERLTSSLSQKISELKRSELSETTQPDGIKRFKVTFTGKYAEASHGK